MLFILDVYKRKPAILVISSVASVCPLRSKTPFSAPYRGKTCPGLSLIHIYHALPILSAGRIADVLYLPDATIRNLQRTAWLLLPKYFDLW